MPRQAMETPQQGLDIHGRSIERYPWCPLYSYRNRIIRKHFKKFMSEHFQKYFLNSSSGHGSILQTGIIIWSQKTMGIFGISGGRFELRSSGILKRKYWCSCSPCSYSQHSHDVIVTAAKNLSQRPNTSLFLAKKLIDNTKQNNLRSQSEHTIK